MPDLDNPIDDPQRLAALRRTGLLDSPPSEPFDNLVRSAAAHAAAPIALVSIVDEDRQYFKSSTSLTGPLAPEQETNLSLSICRHAVASKKPLLIRDAVNDPEFRTHLAVRDGRVGAYAGYPIILDDGHAVGTVCVVDTKPRDWGDEQIEMLRNIATDVVKLINQQIADTDAKAWRTAAEAGLTTIPNQTDVSLQPDAIPRPPIANDDAPNNGDRLAAAAFLYLQQLDAYIGALENWVEGDERQFHSIRTGVVDAEAGLVRAMDAFNDLPAQGRAEGAYIDTPEAMIRSLQEACATFLKAEKHRSRTSLLCRRSIVTIQDLEQAVIASNDAEQAMRLALRDYEISRG